MKGVQMDDKDAQEMAMFRFGLIAPVINGTFTEPTKTAYYKNVTAGMLTLPSMQQVSYSYCTLRWWESLYRKGGFEALLDKGRSDKGYPRKLSQEVIDAIFALRTEFPRINATIIHEKLVEDGTIRANEVSLSTVQRFIRSRKDRMSQALDAKDRRAFEATRVMEMLQADTLHALRVPDTGPKGLKKTYLICVIDDKSRLILSGRFFFSDTALNFQKVFKSAVKAFGCAEKLYVDNGAPYKNDQLSAICGVLGCVLIHAPARDAQATGKAERLNRTIRERFLSLLKEEDKASLESLNDAFVRWVSAYNTKVHSAHGKSPMEVYRAEMDTVRMPRSAEWVDEAFLNRVKRTVRADATVSIDNVSYDVPMIFIKQKVCIRFSPDDMSSAHIIDEGKAYPIRPTDKQANYRAKREKPGFSIDYGKGGADVSTTLPA
jgi:transposase InsO family protein